MNFVLCDAVAGRAARWYKRRCWWAEEEDLRQEAWRACVQASRTFDPERGTPEEAYLWYAAVYAVRLYVLRQSAPVSAAKNRAQELRGVMRAPLERVRTAAAPVEPADEAAIRIQRERAVAGRVRALGGDRRAIRRDYAAYLLWRRSVEEEE